MIKTLSKTSPPATISTGNTFDRPAPIAGGIPGVICDPKTLPDLTGSAVGLTGHLTGLRGNISNITGSVSEQLVGDVSNLSGDVSNLRGNCSGLSGNCTSVTGDCSGVSGDLDAAGITDHHRIHGIGIADLTL